MTAGGRTSEIIYISLINTGVQAMLVLAIYVVSVLCNGETRSDIVVCRLTRSNEPPPSVDKDATIFMISRLYCCHICSLSTACVGIFHNGKNCQTHFQKDSGETVKHSKPQSKITGWENWSVVRRSSENGYVKSAESSNHNENKIQTTKRTNQAKGRITSAPGNIRPTTTQVPVTVPIKLHTPQGHKARFIVGTTLGATTGYFKLDLNSGSWSELTMMKSREFFVSQFAHDVGGDRLFMTVKGAKLVWVKPENLTAMTTYFKFENPFRRDQMFGVAIDQKAKRIFLTGKKHGKRFSDVSWVLMSISLGKVGGDPRTIKSYNKSMFELRSHLVVDPKNEMVYANQKSWNQITGCDYLGKKCITYNILQSTECMTPWENGESVIMGWRVLWTYKFSTKRRLKYQRLRGISSSFLLAQEGLVVFIQKRNAYIYYSNKTSVPILPNAPTDLYSVQMI